MNTYVFDQKGTCVLAVSDEVSAAEFEGKTVAYSSGYHAAGDVWYDHVGGRMAHRVDFPVTVSTNTISGIPAGTTANISGTEIALTDSVFELEVVYPQVVPVTLNHVAYKPLTVEVPCEVQA